jgi:hypothetical protein
MFNILLLDVGVKEPTRVQPSEVRERERKK